jgi:hypothetical protein
MFQNYLITALRNFTRHKLYSFINIAGLCSAPQRWIIRS